MIHSIKIDLFWNYVSLVIMAVAGLAINAIIVRFYDSSALGVYNETYAWYMILSQIAVWGIHMGIVKYVPEEHSSNEKITILKSGLLDVLIVSTLVTGGAYAVILFWDFAWKQFLCKALIGLVFYSINKVLLNYLNAINEMTVYAVIQSVRYVLLTTIIFIVSANGMEANNLAFAFPLTEVAIFLLLSRILFYKGVYFVNGNFSKAAPLMKFGTSILPSNMVVEMNTKVDVVCIGFFVQDVAQIGVYTFAILFTDGMYMLFITLRKIVNPHISEENANGYLDSYLRILKRSAKEYLYPFSLLAYVGILATYYFLCRILVGGEYLVGLLYIAIIGISIALTGRYIMLGDILAQLGYPIEESKINVLTVAFNILMNIVFINVFGLYGAALATSVSYLTFAIMLCAFTKLKLKLRI